MFNFVLRWLENSYRIFRQGQRITFESNAVEGLRMSHEENLDTLSSRCAAAETRASNLQHQVKDVTREKEELAAKLKSLQASHEKRRRDVVHYKRQLDRSQSDYEATRTAHRRIEKDNERLSCDLETTTHQLESCRADLRGAQNSAFKHARSGGYAEEDNSVQECLDGLYKHVRQWAKSYCIQSFENVPSFPEDMRLCLQNAVSERANFPNQDALFDFKYPFLLLAALLSSHLEKFIFRNQFFVFQELGSMQSSDSFCRKLQHTFHQLETIYHDEVDPEVYMCRAQFMRLIFPNARNKDHAVDGKAITKERLDAVYKEICDSFLSSPAFLLMAGLSDCGIQERDHDLLQIVRDAGSIYSRLLTQVVNYRWIDPEHLLGKPFFVRSAAMRADRLQKLVDEEDEACDGRRVGIVVSPTIVCYGNSNGENYTEERIITKGVVFLGHW